MVDLVHSGSTSLGGEAVRLMVMIVVFFGLLSACRAQEGSDTTTSDTPIPDTGSTALAHPHLDCDPLVPEFCGYPFPSDVYTVADPTTPTRRRVAFGPGLLQGNDSGPWDDSDGFSTGAAILTQIPGATGAGLPSSTHIPDSLLSTSPTLILDVQTGEPVPHFAELDAKADGDADRTLSLRPAVRLRDNARYIVAIRGLQDAKGEAVPASPVFTALRDGTASAEPSVAERRELYDDIFGHLEAAGWSRSELQSAWDFSTASDENNTRWMLHMRDEGLSLAGAAPAYTIASVDKDFDPKHIAYRILGTVRVPLYMTGPGPLTVLVFGDDGLPEVNAEQPFAEVPFEILIPNSALKEPAALLQYGHGLFGDKGQIETEHLRTFIDTYNYVMFSVDLHGMASPDEGAVGIALVSGDFAGVRTMWDRLHQGFLNSLVAMRMMKTSFAADPIYGPLIDPTQAFYYGISQGGISGSVYLALSQDVQRGALGVPGQPYSLLLMRSVDFLLFLDIIDGNFPDSRQQQLLVAIAQMPWDRVEPNGYTHHIAANLFPGTSAKSVLMRAAIGDHQVPTLGAQVMARTLGAKHLTSGLRDLWALEPVTSTSSGSFYTEYGFGLPEVPDCGIPMDLCDDPHGKLRQLDSARAQLDEFLRLGTGTNHCPDGVCSYPELSGCDKGEDDAATAAACEI